MYIFKNRNYHSSVSFIYELVNLKVLIQKKLQFKLINIKVLIEKSVGIREERESLYTLFSLVSVLVLDNGVEHSQKGEIKAMM